MPRYFQLTRKHTYSLLFVLPLLLAYEVGAMMISTSSRGLRNGADVLLRSVLSVGGIRGTLGFTAVLAVISIILIVRERRREKVPLQGGVFVGMAAESVVYALVFGMVVGTLTQWLLGSWQLSQGTGVLDRLPLLDGIVLSLGAGLYEELLFRVVLVGGLLAVFLSAGIGKKPARIYAALLAALVFSAFHYIGPYGEAFQVPSFMFRFVAGLALNALFIARGFGIAAWTHALYDVFLTVTHHG
ncbi:MAG TPA: CPBP family intramembrane glutamic endopeptidase [Longimicrobium sp.]|nr:CPBP family intramembrane glutamic endopeptidase [Longimicrobium sp.]